MYSRLPSGSLPRLTGGTCVPILMAERRTCADRLSARSGVGAGWNGKCCGTAAGMSAGTDGEVLIRPRRLRPERPERPDELQQLRPGRPASRWHEDQGRDRPRHRREL